jgi:lipopolysaccharide/colanic/teichoic acid biosynthesis glycosyltransferase
MSTGSLDAGAVTGELDVPAGGSRVTDVSCRILDVVVAALCLVLLLPVLCLIGLAIRLDSPGWVIFRQRRVGRDLEPFTVNKFRTMRADAGHDAHRAYVLRLIAGEAEPQRAGAEPVFKLAGDTRVTRLGGFLRRSSLDELPQLWNVLRGEMSLVGPRPPIPYEVEHYPPHWFARFAVKPGLTGLWQVSGRSDLSWDESVRIDVRYVENWSLTFDFMILWKTVGAVLRGSGAY